MPGFNVFTCLAAMVASTTEYLEAWKAKHANTATLATYEHEYAKLMSKNSHKPLTEEHVKSGLEEVSRYRLDMPELGDSLSSSLGETFAFAFLPCRHPESDEGGSQAGCHR